MSTPDGASRRVFVGWTQGERVAAICFTLLALFVAGQTFYLISEDRAASEREDARQVRADACLAQQIRATRTYLQERGAIAERDRASVTAVLDAFAQAARTESQDPAPIIDALNDYRRTQRALAREREDASLPTFPSGRCVVQGGSSSPSPGAPSRSPSPDQADDEASPSASKKKADRKGRRAPSDPAGRRPTRPPAPTPVAPEPPQQDDGGPLLPDLELPDIDVSDLLDVIGDALVLP